MARVVKPILVGGSWGLGAGIALAAAAVLGPGLRSMAERALMETAGRSSRRTRKLRHEEWDLEDIRAEGGSHAGS